MFSERVPRSLEPNRITHAVRRARADGRTLIDLTATNPTGVGLAYSRSLVAPLASDLALTYSPQPFGLPDARLAVARDYRRRGIDIAADRIVLTASTSEAYSLLFKLLCDPDGDAAMVPVPSYPLFEHLTALDGVRAVPYRLDYEGRWVLSIDDLDREWSTGVRAVLAVSPNNPTGSLVTADEARALHHRCAARDAALIVDEVFADYVLDDRAAGEARRASDVLGAGEALTFRLGGLSKSAGLPQVKLGWIAVQGPERIVAEALERLEVICDAYLSVSTPVQIAAPALIDAGAAVRAQILARIRANHGTLASEAAAYPAVEVLHTDAGWSSVIRVPSTRTEEDLVVDLIDRDGVLVHPGFFFDFPHEAFVVISLLAETQAFVEGLRRVLERVDG
jgi:aspartate/methionine/tyrosine aminotransferase